MVFDAIIEKGIKRTLQIPYIYAAIEKLYFLNFPGSQIYWENRYQKRGNSGSGSYGRLAQYKAEVLNNFIIEKKINTVIEFGCGDGNQLSLMEYPKYIGFDVSKTAVILCKDRFSGDQSKSFFIYDSLCFVDNQKIFFADLTISLDVIFHIIEDDIFTEYMSSLFSSSRKWVIIYASNFNDIQTYHEKRREFTRFVEINFPTWRLDQKIDNKYPYDQVDPDNTSLSDFYIFCKHDEHS